MSDTKKTKGTISIDFASEEEKALWNDAKETAHKIVKKGKKVIKEAAEDVVEMTPGVKTIAREGKRMVKAGKRAVKESVDAIVDAMPEELKDLAKEGKKLAEDGKETLKKTADNVVDAIPDSVKNAFAEGKRLAARQAALLTVDGIGALNDIAKLRTHVLSLLDQSWGKSMEYRNAFIDGLKQGFPPQLTERLEDMGEYAADALHSAQGLLDLPMDKKRALATDLLKKGSTTAKKWSSTIMDATHGFVEDTAEFWNLPYNKKMEMTKGMLSGVWEKAQERSAELVSGGVELASDGIELAKETAQKIVDPEGKIQAVIAQRKKKEK